MATSYAIPRTPVHPVDSDLPSLVNYVFVDYENVHKVDPDVIGRKTVCFTLLLGAKQTKLDAELVEKLLAHAASVQLVRLTTSGKNALDFALAYYVGRAVITNPTAFFHIVSKDTGYDPLVEHLRSRHVRARRHNDFSSLTFGPPVRQVVPPVPDDLTTRALEHLRKNTTNRPKRKKTLASHLLAFAGKNATEPDIENLIGNLRMAGHLSLDDKDAVTYRV